MNENSRENDELMSPSEVEKRLNISADTRRRAAKKGTLPRVVLASGAVRYKQSDVEAFQSGGAR